MGAWKFTTWALQKHGYHVGHRAKKRLFVDEPEDNPRGRPRISEQPHLLQLAQEVLGRHSKPGSKVVTVQQSEEGKRKVRGRVPDTEGVAAMSLLAAPGSIYDMEPELQKNMSVPSWRRLLKEHFGEYRLGARRTDICTHCNTFHTKVVPDFKHFLQKARADLEAILPSYFNVFDESGGSQEDADKGDWAKVAKTWLRYLHGHNEQFFEERASLTAGQRLALFSEVEAPLEHELKGRISLLNAYQWHMLSARRQGEVFRTLIDTVSPQLPHGHCLLAFDWRQKLKLPMGPEETGTMWHAQQKIALSCWGGCLVQHTAKSSAAKPQVQMTFFLFLTDVVEQTAEASNLMLSEALNAAKVPENGVLQLWSDTGPHFRSAENLYFYARKLPQKRNQTIWTRWLGEQHGKSILDEMFGWTGVHRSGWLGKYVQTAPIYNLEDMVKAFRKGAAAQVKKDPKGPKWIVKHVPYPELKANIRHFLYAPSMKISRTYAVDAEPYRGRANVSPPLFNRVFADCSQRQKVTDWRIETLEVESPDAWRKSFFDGTKDWENEPPDWNADHHLKRVFEVQKNKLPPREILPYKTLEDRVASKAKRQEKAKQRLQRKQQYIEELRQGRPAELSSSSSSDTTDSDESERSKLKNKKGSCWGGGDGFVNTKEDRETINHILAICFCVQEDGYFQLHIWNHWTL